MSTLFVCNKINSLKSEQLIELNDVNLSSSVSSLCSAIAEKIGIRYENDEPTFELICFGKQLKPEKQLSTFGVRNGCIVYLFPVDKGVTNVTGKARKPKLDGSQPEIGQMVIALRTALMNQSFRSMLHKLYEKESKDNIFACTPALKNDPTAMAILQDPDLLALLTDPESIEKVLEKHPCLLEAATHLAAAFHEDALTSNSNSMPNELGGYFSIPSSNSYSLDDLSDDEYLGGGVDAAPPDGQAVMSPRTADSFRQLLQQHSLMSRMQTGASTSNQRITSEMLLQALQASQASTSSLVPQNLPQTRSQPAPSQNQPRDWSQQIRQFHEVGIFDNALIVQTLEAMNGDVQAAINFILG